LKQEFQTAKKYFSAVNQLQDNIFIAKIRTAQIFSDRHCAEISSLKLEITA